MTEETPGAGHNSGVSAGQLRSYVERVERLEEEKRETAEQIKEVCAEAKSAGFDAKTLRRIVRERRKDREQRAEEEALFELYWSALQ